MKNRTRYWTINGDFLALQPTGVPRYAREITFALDTLISEKHPLTENLCLNLVAPCCPAELPLQNISTRHIAEYSKPRLPQFWVQFQLPRHVHGGLLSFCNLAPVAIKRHIVCIHDLHTMLQPESYGRGFRLAHRMILPALGRRAGAITTVSSLSRDHLIKFGIAPPNKITVTYNGADHARRWNPSVSQLVPGLRPYVFCIGQNQAYKNMQLIWSIAPALDAMGLDIYIAGSISEDVLRSYGGEVPKNLRLLGRVSDDDLAIAFRSALCFLFPSRIEGFGIPAIEAMTWDCPVIAADAPCLPEVCGDAALYAGPDDAQGWIDTVGRLMKDFDLRQQLIVNGHQRSKRYSWRHIAETYLEIMARLDGINMAGISADHMHSRASGD